MRQEILEAYHKYIYMTPDLKNGTGSVFDHGAISTTPDHEMFFPSWNISYVYYSNH